VTDDVEFADYDPRWPERFALEALRMRAVLAEPQLEIEHHGSTAVPGLAAKPVTMSERLLSFRHHLRAHPEIAAEYAELKRSLAGVHGDDRHGSMSAKGEFMQRITATAMRGGHSTR
jgi:GrpB-like predicted nucleotidyltransferase (UPF0157 family)